MTLTKETPVIWIPHRTPSISCNSLVYKEWYQRNKNIFDTSTYRTPDTEEQPVLSLVHKCLESIDLDPTSDENWTGAKRHCTKDMDSLNYSWRGHSIFMNPPFLIEVYSF